MSIVLDTVKRVVDQSDHVFINHQALKSWSNLFSLKNVCHWFDKAPFDIDKLNEKDRLHYLFVFNSISFSYWSGQKWRIDYDSQVLDGAYGMIAALGRALEEGIPVTDFEFLSKMKKDDFSYILRGENKIPLFNERLGILKEIGSIVSREYSGQLINFIKNSNSTEELLPSIVHSFPSFKDESFYKGNKVFFYKRAQLFIADMLQSIRSIPTYLNDISNITACADYKLPQMLRRFGIFEYSPDLKNIILSQGEIDSGHPFEIEIRANTIWSVHLMKEIVKAKFPEIDDIQINDHLWLLSQRKLDIDEPYHHTRTTAY